MTNPTQKFIVRIDGNPVAYAKRIRARGCNRGYAVVWFVGDLYEHYSKGQRSAWRLDEPSEYTERVAKGWVTALSKNHQNVTMEPVKS